MCLISSLKMDVVISNSDNKKKILVYTQVSSKILPLLFFQGITVLVIKRGLCRRVVKKLFLWEQSRLVSTDLVKSEVWMRSACSKHGWVVHEVDPRLQEAMVCLENVIACFPFLPDVSDFLICSCAFACMQRLYDSAYPCHLVYY